MWIILENSVAFLTTLRQGVLVISTIRREEREKQTKVSKFISTKAKFFRMVVRPLLRVTKGYLKQKKIHLYKTKNNIN